MEKITFCILFEGKNIFLTNALLIDKFIKCYQTYYFIYKLIAAQKSCKKASIHFLPTLEVVYKNSNSFN